MFRIDTPNKATDLFGAGKHGFRDGDQALGVAPTELSAAQQNALQEELAGIIEAAGIVLNKASNTQLLEAIQRLIDAQSGNYALDTGAANAYVVALNPAIVAYTDGMTVRVKAVNANTGASTLNAGAGAVGLVNDVGGALADGDVPAGGIFSATYIASAAKFHITSLVQSQGDARYALRGGSVNNKFLVYNATGGSQEALPIAQAEALFVAINAGRSAIMAFSSGANQVAPGSLAFLGSAYTSLTMSHCWMRVPFTGKIKAIYTQASNAGAPTYYEIAKNGLGTGVSLTTVGVSTQGQVGADLSVTAGDYLSIVCNPVLASGQTAWHNVALEIQKT